MNHQSKPLVIIVEDDEGLRSLMTEILEGEEIPVRSFECGIPALDFMRDEGVPKIVIVDLKIPDLDPISFKSHLSNLPDGDKTFVIVASGDSKIEEWSQRLNAITFIKKPYDIDIFIMTVQSVLDIK